MKIVVPVRLATHERVTQTTSRELTASRVQVASQQHAHPGELMAVRLYLPDAQLPAGMLGKVLPQEKEGEVWVDLLDGGSETSARISDLLSKHGSTPAARRSPHRTTIRYPTSIAASVLAGGKRFAARAIDLSSGGAFLRCNETLELGDVVTLSLLMPTPGDDERIAVSARIVHVNRTGPRHAPWSEPGMGLQFIDGDDVFRTNVDRFLRRVSYRAKRAS